MHGILISIVRDFDLTKTFTKRDIVLYDGSDKVKVQRNSCAELQSGLSFFVHLHEKSCGEDFILYLKEGLINKKKKITTITQIKSTMHH